MMKKFFAVFVLFIFLNACSNSERIENTECNATHFLHDIVSFTSDSLVNVVIEIPAGTSQKWEVNKVSGQIEWEQVTPDSFRVIDYLPYPANYGFVPQTILPEVSGGDGDALDVFVLGPSIGRGEIVQARIVGIIHVLDNNESDPKLLAVNTNVPCLKINAFEMLASNYPGVIDILKLWLLHYKRSGDVKILSINDEREAFRFLKSAHNHYIEQKSK